jgi:transposase
VAGIHRWHGDDEARRAVDNNRARLQSGVAREAFKRRAELCERSFALLLDRGGMRDDVEKVAHNDLRGGGSW